MRKEIEGLRELQEQGRDDLVALGLDKLAERIERFTNGFIRKV